MAQTFFPLWISCICTVYCILCIIIIINLTDDWNNLHLPRVQYVRALLFPCCTCAVGTVEGPPALQPCVRACVRASRAAGLTVGLCHTSKAASGFVLLPFQTKPRWRMSVHRPAFIWRFEEASCWDRPELRKRGANWKLILVWVPEMSAAPVIPASPELLSTIITFSGRQCSSGHSPADPGNFPS